MPTAVVTGCNSGIGHAFAQILCSEGYKVHALDVNVGPKLESLVEQGAQISNVGVTSQTSIDSFKKLMGDEMIDLLLNIAGIMYPSDQDALTTTNPNVLNRTFAVNTIGPLSLTQALLPNLLRSSNPGIGIMSSRVGSVGDNTSGGSYAYRASKAAVNSIGRSMAMDLKKEGVVVVIMHPGYVKTGLNTRSPPHPESVEPDEAASKLWKVLMSKGMEDTGKFWHREGQELPW